MLSLEEATVSVQHLLLGVASQVAEAVTDHADDVVRVCSLGKAVVGERNFHAVGQIPEAEVFK
jgi:hypothetical protein